jgi:hypothetical protein
MDSKKVYLTIVGGVLIIHNSYTPLMESEKFKKTHEQAPDMNETRYIPFSFSGPVMTNPFTSGSILGGKN